jgi:hypothetical protein
MTILIFPGSLHNYNLTFKNWTYLTNPITSQVIYCFSNTNDCTQELTAVQNAATTWNASGAAFAFPQIQKGPGGGFAENTRDGQNQMDGDIFYLKSTNHGSSFPYASRISTTDSMSGDTKISLGYVYQNSYILHVVWQEDYPAGEEVHYASNKSWESVWSSPQRISYNGTNCYGVSVSAYGYNIHLAWSQKVGSESDYEIHHRRNRARGE